MIRAFADWLVFEVMAFRAGTPLADAVHFFIYDTLKILLLLYLVSALMGFVNAYFPMARVREFLSNRKLFGVQYLLAALFGAITPFCTCSSVPLFIGFVRGGIPLGVTFSFLITSPLVNEIAVAMFLGTFGLKATLVYAASGILLGSVGGWLLGKCRLERFLSSWAQEEIQNESIKENTNSGCGVSLSFFRKSVGILSESQSTVTAVLPYVIAGIAVGAGVHGFVPAGFFENLLQGERIWDVPAAVIIAVPMYANAAAIVPVIQVFVAKGIPLGTAIAFMMATVGLSLPEAILLKKVMSWRLIGIFFSCVAAGIIALGYLFNAIL